MFSLTPRDAGGVDLHDVDRPGLQQLLEDDPVLRRARRWRPGSGATRAADGGVAEHVVGAGRLLDPVRVVRRERAGSSRSASPTSQRWLASIGDADVRAARPRGRCRRRRTSSSRSPPTFSLICVKPSATASRARRRQLLVVVAEPAGRRRVGRIAVARAARAARSAAAALGARSRISSASSGVSASREVAEVDERDELLRASARRAAARAACPRAWRRGPRAR